MLLRWAYEKLKKLLNKANIHTLNQILQQIQIEKLMRLSLVLILVRRL